MALRMVLNNPPKDLDEYWLTYLGDFDNETMEIQPSVKSRRVLLSGTHELEVTSDGQR
jgi:hypothetical protein